MPARPAPWARQLALAILLAAFATAACSDGGRAPGGEQPTIERTSEGDMTVVRNLSGSAWGSGARLQEELSIGVLEGDADAMFGSIADLWLAEDRIYVLDNQDVSVRVFDRGGRFLRRFAGAGQGPGELDLPDRLVVTDDGRVLVSDTSKVVVYATTGEHLADWPLHTSAVHGLVATPEGLFARVSLPREDPGRDAGRPPTGFRRLGPDGLGGDVRRVPDLGVAPRRRTFRLAGRPLRLTVPLTLPGTVAALAPSGDLVYGFPVDRYRFYIQRPDGRTLAVERRADPVPVAEGEREEARLQLLSLLRQRDPAAAWDGAEIPEVRPYYEQLIPDRSGRVWVGRHGASRPVQGCDPPDRRLGVRSYVPCWEPERILEAFSLVDGVYLGALERPDNTGFRKLSILGDHLAAAVLDDAGTPVVKLFRLVLPDADAKS